MRFAALVLRVRLFCEKLTDILEGFELEGVAGRVEEEHGGLFAREVFEADIGFDDKFDPAGFEPAFQLVPVFPVQYYTIMRDGYVMTIDGIMVQTFRYGRPGFQVNDELMAGTAPNSVFMHCLPAHRNEEVTDAVIDSPRSVVFDQAENRMHIQKAILAMLIGGSSKNDRLPIRSAHA